MCVCNGILLIHSSVDVYFSLCCLVMMNNAAMNNWFLCVCGYFVFNSLKYNQNIDLGVKLVGYMITSNLRSYPLTFLGGTHFSDSPYFLWPWQLWRVLLRYFVECPSNGTFLMVLSQLDWSNVFINEVIEVKCHFHPPPPKVIYNQYDLSPLWLI